MSLTGIRILLDIYLVSKVGDIGRFGDKLKKLTELGFVTETKMKTLSAAIDAGNAAAHRGFKPYKETLFQIMDIVENLLESETLDNNVNSITSKIPKRP